MTPQVLVHVLSVANGYVVTRAAGAGVEGAQYVATTLEEMLAIVRVLMGGDPLEVPEVFREAFQEGE